MTPKTATGVALLAAAVAAAMLAGTAALAREPAQPQAAETGVNGEPADPAPNPELSAEPAPSTSGIGFYFRVGGLFIAPLGKSGEVSLENVTGTARLSVSDGPIRGSSVGNGSNLMAAGTLGWSLPILDRRLAVETVLALPFTMKLSAGGTLANQSLSPTALGTLPTGVPALGSELGEARVLPPVVTLTCRFGPFWLLQPYIGAGVSYLMVLDAHITNPTLTEVATPKMEIPNKLGLALQAGLNVRLHGRFYATLDAKYIAGFNLTAKVKDIYVRLPNLPLYGAVHVGDNSVNVSVDPLVVQLGVGMEL